MRDHSSSGGDKRFLRQAKELGEAFLLERNTVDFKPSPTQHFWTSYRKKEGDL